MFLVYYFIYFSCHYHLADVVGVLAGIEYLKVFVDGCLVGHNNDIWHAATWISFPSETKIVAVSVYHETGSPSGFLGVFSNGVVTDRSWKCKRNNSPENGWEQTNFSDDAWPYAHVMSYNNSVSKVIGIPSNTHWIRPAHDRTNRFYCRRRFSEEERNDSSSKYQ